MLVVLGLVIQISCSPTSTNQLNLEVSVEDHAEDFDTQSIEVEQTTVTEKRVLKAGELSSDVAVANLIQDKVTSLEVSCQNGTDLGLIDSLQELERLRVSGSLNEVAIHKIARISKLQHLDLTWCQFEKFDLSVFRNLSQLESCTFPSCNWVGDSEVKEFVNLDRLITLIIPDASITDSGLTSIASLQHLSHLNIAGSKVTDQGVVNLKEHKKLRYLNLDGILLKEATLTSLEKALPGIRISGQGVRPKTQSKER